MTVSILNVAEKPSVAKEVSRILSNNSARQSRTCSRYNPLWEFSYALNGRDCLMIFTSVIGHLMQLEFGAGHRKWHSCNPIQLFDAPVEKHIPEGKKDIERNLQQQARHCQLLVLWLDCDREGENISFEVIDVCRGANPGLGIKRAHFSALVASHLHRAVNNLVDPNANEAQAVDARQEIDLRVGASFTRFQTLLLQSRFDWTASGMEAEKPLLSYGPCQFPTLGLIVQRAWEIQSHVVEIFWFIFVAYKTKDGSCDFTWARKRIFDHVVAAILYEICVNNPMATILKVDGREKKRWPPAPLSTLEMQKRGTMYLRIPGERLMKYAEELYQAGYISYPRTETDVFDPAIDIRSLVNEHVQDNRWGAHAQSILDGTMWKPPRGGGHDDKAHPPIHPTRYSAGEPEWDTGKKKLYEFITRSFLATCSKDAVGFQTSVTIDIAGESFHTAGLTIRERNWLDVYPYENWGGNSNLPDFQEGQTFMPTQLLLKEGRTQPPPRLAEKDLIGAMERHGIGTDATVAEHIQKQLDRGYAEKNANLEFWPTTLGESLISAYCRMGLDNLWKPDLRGRIESGIGEVAAGRQSKQQILHQAITAFREDLTLAQLRSGAMVNEIGQFFDALAGQGQQDAAPGASSFDIGPCKKCGMLVSLLCPASGPPSVRCAGLGPLCDTSLSFPRAVYRASPHAALCGGCAHGPVRLVRLEFRVGLLPASVQQRLPDPTRHVACVMCGDEVLAGLREECGAARGRRRGGGFSTVSTATTQGGSRTGQHADVSEQHRTGGSNQSSQQWAQGSNQSNQQWAQGSSQSNRQWGQGSNQPNQQWAQGSNQSNQQRGQGSSHSNRQWAQGSNQSNQRRTQGSSQATLHWAPGSDQGAHTFAYTLTESDRGPDGGGGHRGGRTQNSRGRRGRGRNTVARGRRGGRGGQAGRGGRANGDDGAPRCPMHDLPLLVLTARRGAHVGRRFVKCPNSPERDQCLSFAWEDEYGGGQASQGGANRGRRGRGNADGGSRGYTFANAAGDASNVCFKCGQPGHWAQDCPSR